MSSLIQTIASLVPWQRGHRLEFFHNFLHQIYYTFIQSFMMLSFLGMFCGIAIAFQTKIGLALVGNNDQLGKILVLIIFREITPLVTSLILIARSVTAIAAEMATIKVQQEVEALKIMGIDIYHYLLAPRIASGAVSLFCMATTFWAFALWGGWIGANYDEYFPLNQYLTSIAQSIRGADFPFFIVKTSLIGAIVTHIACKRGLSLHKAPYEVPIVTNRAVVDSLTVAMGVQFILSASYYAIFGFDL